MVYSQKTASTFGVSYFGNKGVYSTQAIQGVYKAVYHTLEMRWYTANDSPTVSQQTVYHTLEMRWYTACTVSAVVAHRVYHTLEIREYAARPPSSHVCDWCIIPWK